MRLPIEYCTQGSYDEESTARLDEEKQRSLERDAMDEAELDDKPSKISTFRANLPKQVREWGSDDESSSERLERENQDAAPNDVDEEVGSLRTRVRSRTNAKLAKKKSVSLGLT